MRDNTLYQVVIWRNDEERWQVMAVAKGQIQEDKSYQYTCGKCKGQGMIDARFCNHCYNLRHDLLSEQFQTAKGEQYYAILKAILSIKGKAIYDKAVEINAQNGKFTPVDIAYLSILFGFEMRMKALCEWLEECQFLPTGLYEDLREKGMGVRDMLELAERKYHVNAIFIHG